MTLSLLEQELVDAFERDGYCIVDIRALPTSREEWFASAKRAAQWMGQSCATGEEGDRVAAFLTVPLRHRG